MQKNTKLIIGAVTVLAIVVIVVGMSINSNSTLTEVVEDQSTPVAPVVEDVDLEGILSFEPASGEFKAGDVFSVDVIADTKGKAIAGTDIVIKYNPTMLEVIENEGTMVETTKGFFVLFPADGQTKSDIFQFSVLTQAPKAVEGKIATVYFSAKKAGEAKLEFIFEAGKTNDSNLASAEKGKDILASVLDAAFQIVK